MPISAVDCVQPAIQHAREQLFRPFRWGQWSRLALVGILAAELNSGGCNFPSSFVKHHGRKSDDLLPRGFPGGIPHIDPAHLAQFALLIGVALLAFAVLVLVFMYINSVFRFILFDSVLRRECAIGEGWQRWRHAGRRFFLWQLVYQFAVAGLLLVAVGIPALLFFLSGVFSSPMQHVGRFAGAVILLGFLFLASILIAAAVRTLARDFLVPLMALEHLDFADAWSRLLALIRVEPGRYVIYLFLKVVLAIAAAIVFGILAIIPVLIVVLPAVILFFVGKAMGLGWTVITISLAIISGSLLLLVLIYVIALVSVPATVFFPAYSIYFFAARYPNLNAILYPAPTPAPPQPAAAPENPPPEPPPLPPTPEPIG